MKQSESEVFALVSVSRLNTIEADLKAIKNLICQAGMGREEPQDRILTTAGAAEYLSCSKNHLEKLRTMGGGPKYKNIGEGKRPLIRYRLSDLQTYIQNKTRRHTSE